MIFRQSLNVIQAKDPIARGLIFSFLTRSMLVQG